MHIRRNHITLLFWGGWGLGISTNNQLSIYKPIMVFYSELYYNHTNQKPTTPTISSKIKFTDKHIHANFIYPIPWIPIKINTLKIFLSFLLIFKLFLNTDSLTCCLPFNKCKTTFLLNGLYSVWNQQNQVVPTLWLHNMNLPLREYGEQDDVSGCPPLGLLLTVEFQRCSLQIAGKKSCFFTKSIGINTT